MNGTFSGNLNLNPQFIYDNPQYPWKLDHVFRRPDIPIDSIIERYSHLGEEVWINLMSRDDMTIEYIEAHPEYPWPYSHSCELKNLTIEFLKKHEAVVQWWHNIHFNREYTIKEFITAFPNRIDEETILHYTGMTSGQVILADDTLINALSNSRTCKNIPGIVDMYPDAKWDWTEISFNPHLTIPFIKKYRAKLDWGYLTSVIDKKVINANPCLPWDFNQFHYRNDITRSSY